MNFSGTSGFLPFASLLPWLNEQPISSLVQKPKSLDVTRLCAQAPAARFLQYVHTRKSAARILARACSAPSTPPPCPNGFTNGWEWKWWRFGASLQTATLSRSAGCRPLSTHATGLLSDKEAPNAHGGSVTGEPAPKSRADEAKEADLKDVLTLLDEKKAMDVVILHASEIERMRVLCDYMVILTCTGHRHMKIVADHVVDHFRLKGMLVEVEDEDGIVRAMPPSAEDPNSEEWMLVDLQHIIVQIFSREGRAKYTLEEHWRSMSNDAVPKQLANEDAAEKQMNAET